MRSNLKLAAAALALLAATASACGGSSSSSSSSAAGGDSSSSSAGGSTSGALKVVSDLPLQGASGAQSKTVNQAEQFYLANQGGKAGKYSVSLAIHDDSTAAAAKWDENTCKSNATGYVNDKSIVGVLGTFNSGCAKIEVPIANQAALAMISPANTAVGLTHKGLGSDPGEPDVYYPTSATTPASSPPTTSRAPRSPS
jgi:branched-chain amino acid transport system substrate-binding protein